MRRASGRVAIVGLALGLLAACSGGSDEDGPKPGAGSTSGVNVSINCLGQRVVLPDGRTGVIIDAARGSDGVLRGTVRLFQHAHDGNTDNSSDDDGSGDVNVTIGDNVCGDRTHPPTVVQPTPDGPRTPAPVAQRRRR